MPSTSLLHYGSLFRWALATVILAAAGLNYIYLKHQFHLAGTRRVALETELAALMVKSRDLDWQISSLTSQTAVQGRLKVSSLKLKEIPEGSTVNLSFLTLLNSQDGMSTTGNSENRGDLIRTISHDRPRSR